MHLAVCELQLAAANEPLARQSQARQPVDISIAVLWLASEESRYVTGPQLTVDAGQMLK